MKKREKKLELTKETVRNVEQELEWVKGGRPPVCEWTMCLTRCDCA